MAILGWYAFGNIFAAFFSALLYDADLLTPAETVVVTLLWPIVAPITLLRILIVGAWRLAKRI